MSTTAATTRSMIWVDAQGRTRQTILQGSATLAAVEAALIGVSNADTQKTWEGLTTINGAPATTNALYSGVGDYVPLVFTDATGQLVYVTLVAPQAGIFMADNETVDPVAIATLIAAVLATVTTANGNPLVAYSGGVRRRAEREYQ